MSSLRQKYIELYEQITKRDWACWAVFLMAEMVLLTLLFVRFPWNGSFFSDIDIWFYVLQLNDFYLNVTGDQTYGRFFFPETDYKAIMDSPLGLGSMILPFKFFFSNDLWAYFFYTIFILAMDGLAVAMLGKALGIKRGIAMALAVLLVLNNFMLSQLDNFNSIAFFPGVFAAYCLLRFFQSTKGNRVRWLAGSAYLASFQLYVSIYHFVFQFLLFLLIAILAMNWKRHYRSIPGWFFLIAMLILPFVLQHGALPEYLSDPSWLASQPYYTSLHSIHFGDLFRVNPGNLLYSAMEDISNPWRYGARSAFVGYATYLSAIAAAIWLYRKGHRRWVLAIALVMFLSFLAASGPYIDLGNLRILTPSGWVYKWMPGSVLFRHLFRAYHYFPMAMMFLIGLALTLLYRDHAKQVKIFLAGFALIFILENFPWLASLHESYKFIVPPKALNDVMEAVPDSSNVYFLPSCEQFRDEVVFSQTMNPHSREFIYANWKQSFDINVFNGRLAYLTEHSFNNNQLLCHIDSARFSNLLIYNDIDFFIVAKEYTDASFRENFMPLLERTCPVVRENERFVVYNPKPYFRSLVGLNNPTGK